MDPDTLYRSLGQLIRHHRKQHGITQEQLARQVGLSRPSIANIERGKQNVLLHQLYQVAAALRVSIDVLLPPMSESEVSEEVDRKLEDIPDATESEKEWARRVMRSSTTS